MAQFVLFYVNGPAPASAPRTEEEMQSIVSEYAAWSEKMTADGRLVAHSRLTDVYTDPGRVCAGRGDSFVVTEGPLAETREVIGGYAVIEAADYDDAVAQCRDHPAAGSGKIEIRQHF